MKTFLFIVRLLPIVTALVREVEGLIPGSGKGREKLTLALAMADMVWQQEAELRAAWPEPAVFTATVSLMVSAAVGALNAAGVFGRD